MNGKPVLGYWNTRCIAEPIRLMLEYCGIEYLDKRYQCGPAPSYDKSCWFNEKFKLGLTFPNLPYFIDNDVKITESWAILRYIAKQNSLMPTNFDEEILCENIQGVIADFHNDFIAMCYSKDHKTLKKSYLDTIAWRLKMLDDYLHNKKYLMGEKLSYPDFVFFEAADQHQMLFINIFENYKNIKQYINNFKNLKTIRLYLESNRFARNLVHSPYAGWSGEN